MNDKSQSAVNSLIDQAINKVVHTLDSSIYQAVLQGAKLVAGSNGNPGGESQPIVGALACDFDACITPWVDAIRQDLHEAAAMRLLYRADRLDRPEAGCAIPRKPVPKPAPATNGQPKNGQPYADKPQNGKPKVEQELKGGLD